jgi:valyl-tRNA synthetase
MIIAGLEFKPGKSERDEDNIAFHDVFFTGIIRDKQRRKMSKSLGNSPDPLDLIAKYGADGLRFGLMRIAPSGQDIRFDEKQIEEGRNFATKLWNAARFRQMHGPSNRNPELKESELSIYAIEVLARLNEAIGAVETAYREYQFNTVAQRLYDFVWGDFCDWFVETAKTDIFGEDAARKQSTLATMDFVLSAIVRLLHPFMPHLTEELWSLMGFADGEVDFLDFASLPEIRAFDYREVATARVRVGAIYEMIDAGRNLRAEARVPSNQKAKFVLRSNETWVKEEMATIARLLNAESLEINPGTPAPGQSSVAATNLGELFLVAGETDRAAERERLEKEIAKLEADLKVTEAKLANQSFVGRAPKDVVEEHRRRRDDFNARLAQLRKARESLD